MLKQGDLVFFKEEWEDEKDLNHKNIPFCSLASVVALYSTNDPIFSRNHQDLSEILLLNTQHYGEIFVNNDGRILKFNREIR